MFWLLRVSVIVLRMADQWIIRVHDKEYGPVDLEGLREWKREGRLLPENPARRVDIDFWTRAADIPELFAAAMPPVQSASASPLGLVSILAEAFRIYRNGFLQFFCLALLVVLPSLCGQLVGASIAGTPNAEFDLRTLGAGAFAFCMFLLTIVLWPVYIAGIQIVTGEQVAGRRIGFIRVLSESLKFWPRLAVLCLIVYGVFALLMLLALAIAGLLAAGAASFLSILIALALLALQVWMFGRWFIRVLFWQQAAVLEGTGVAESLRRSEQIARSGETLPWYSRPWWRGALIASLWLAFVLAITIGPQWASFREYFNQTLAIQDPQLLLQKLSAAEQVHHFNRLSFALGVLQRILQPLLGIAFVVLFFDSKQSGES